MTLRIMTLIIMTLNVITDIEGNRRRDDLREKERKTEIEMI
jgi:hypothetical protein